MAASSEPTELAVDLSSGIIVNLTVFPQIFGEEASFDETMSMQSGFSEGSIGAAEFDNLDSSHGFNSQVFISLIVIVVIVIVYKLCNL